ncbi:hypothetical protein F2Q70_00019201 [Brassica cretica]|uniref:Uncharacterized protein n=1 Tax=Brassica cretica TaxID=69181 RepID=A0A8S9GS86_BRACR|nr:hypothetical protein F2Q70_00019201 [Brassica cretica]
MVLIFHSFKGFSDLDLICRKSSRRLLGKSSGLPGSLLMMSPFHNRSERFGFSDLKDFWDNLPVSRLKYNALHDFQEVFQATSRKSSRRLPGSLPDDFQEVFQTTSRKSSRRLLGSPDDFPRYDIHGGRLVDFQRSRPFRRLPESLPDDFHFSRLDFLKVVWTSWKSYGLPGSCLDFLEVV